MNPRIAVTGIGLVSRFGGLDATWGAALEGRDGAVALQGPDWKDVPVRTAAVVPDGALARTLTPKTRRFDRAVQLALAAARDAWADAGPTAGDARPDRRAVLIGSSRSCLETTEKSFRAYLSLDGAVRMSPFDTPFSLPFCPTSAVSIELQCQGPTVGLTAACASSAHAIGLAAKLIQAGMADLALAGGTESSLTPWYLTMAHQSGILTTGACRPFDRRRDGTLLGEGAGVLVLERWDHAVGRGARIRAELLGYGATSDAESFHAPSPGGGPLASAIRQAMKEASVEPLEIGLIKAHGTATLKGDLAEAAAIRTALGDAAARIPTASLKAVVGHAIGASAAIESALALMALKDRRLPPTANLEQPDPALGLHLVRGAPAPVAARAALVNSVGFGGTNVALVFQGA